MDEDCITWTLYKLLENITPETIDDLNEELETLADAECDSDLDFVKAFKLPDEIVYIIKLLEQRDALMAMILIDESSYHESRELGDWSLFSQSYEIFIAPHLQSAIRKIEQSIIEYAKIVCYEYRH